ncbi:MAG: V-type ATPase subunit [Clostridia bacterium]|nr:V-type ATPase subunit [Clostridia bacterium]
MKEGLIFANARAKAKEGTLLSRDRLQRMTEAKTVESAVRILLEANYAGGMIPEEGDFYSLLTEEEKIVTAFVRETVPEGAGFECFFLRNDYHNIKVLVKAKYAKLTDLDDLILPDGNFPFAELKERYESGKLDFSPFVSDAIATIEKAFETNVGGPRLIDTELDKALYRDIFSRLEKGADRYVKEYFTAFVDTTNVASFVRSTRVGAGFAFFKEGFLEGGEISLKDFEECGTDAKRAASMLSGTKVKDYFEKIDEQDLASFETAQDNYLLKIFSINKTDMFSVAPILGYYLAKLNEIKIIRVVMVCIKNAVPAEETRKRLRELYA